MLRPELLFSLSGLRNQKNESAARGWNLCLSGINGVDILEPNVNAADFNWPASGFLRKVENPPESQDEPGELPSKSIKLVKMEFKNLE